MSLPSAWPRILGFLSTPLAMGAVTVAASIDYTMSAHPRTLLPDRHLQSAPATDATLLTHRVEQGDPQAFAVLVARHADITVGWRTAATRQTVR